MAQKSEAELEDERQYRMFGLDELEELYPHRPRNHSKTITFWDLCSNVFIPLVENRSKPGRRSVAYARHKDRQKLAPFEIRRAILEHFISRWRKTVGDDIYPAFRLILPDKDKERAMYGLKEKTIAKLLVKAMKIDMNSDDAQSILNWKLPGHNFAATISGDFAARCYEVLAKRPLRGEPGTMTLADVNEKLDALSAVQKDEDQRPIFEEFYRLMNPEELQWLIRIILRQMKVGASERTIFHIWHPDAENLFSICSNLRRVCWELSNPETRLGGSEVEVSLMQCFQPQLAQFQMHAFDRMIERVIGKEDESTFWIEEKLDGERMQLHMVKDSTVTGGRRFGYWSRRAKDYTYLYGGSYGDIGSLTKYLKNAFDDGVENIILDGEMITWDADSDMMLPFGTLKTAALADQQAEMESSSQRPFFKAFDVVYLNGKCLTNYALRDRRRALQTAVKGVHRRLEIHPYTEASTAAEIEPLLRSVIAERGEGLVIKNPNSMYRLNERNDDWMKVKPEYMNEFGENLDLVVIGGYWGSGRRGGILSSYLCGLRVVDSSADPEKHKGVNPLKCVSFCKCGGGFSVGDYNTIKHATDGKWQTWNPAKPPSHIIELAGGNLQHERPDVWISPEDSVVIEVKAASVATTDLFALGLTLRFPRFKKLRTDKTWKEALSIAEFIKLKQDAENEKQEKEFELEQTKRNSAVHRSSKKRKMVIAGHDGERSRSASTGRYHDGVRRRDELFGGLKFLILSDAAQPQKRTKEQLEQLVKSHGGVLVQTQSSNDDACCIADRRTVKVASLIKSGKSSIIRPQWLFDCISQYDIDEGKTVHLLPLEEDRHIFFSPPDIDESSLPITQFGKAADRYGDSFARDTSVDELRELFAKMGGDGKENGHGGSRNGGKKMTSREREELWREIERGEISD